MCPGPWQQKHSEIFRLEDEVYRITRINAVPTPQTPLATRAAISYSQAEPSAGQPSVASRITTLGAVRSTAPYRKALRQ
jgi:hypothetical protein